ncbi:hypothetical protein PENANT_c009G00061 [Penicillium antarcticum]|uniref:RRM domain-containing protein n=1 Tax=Penicillium antarcticum TaxID=416450 RepID=A0A1V6Q9G6_9EURO|nr:hypothetical protein PENANT_c009G00061 [Penicillium antarcticum]
MLKPFQIRNLRVSKRELADSCPSSGVVQISSTDYDDLATTHPRARLTYTDEDEDEDDETITVGSGLELSQRLEEPPEIGTRLESIQLSHDATPMHIFDIRRSNSVSELWKRYECEKKEQCSSEDVKSDAPVAPQAVIHENEVPAATGPTSPPTSQGESRSLMEAFEVELAGILNAAELSGARGSQPEPQPAEPSASTSSERPTHPVEVLAAQVLDQLINGATMVQSEWRARLPELQRQLHNAQRQFETAQRSLPANVEASLRTLLNTLEAQLRAAFNNIPDGGRQFAEDAFQRGRPVAENAADGLRMMASELNEVGRTLFAAFENEFGRAGPAPPSTSGAPSSGVPGTSDINANAAENRPASSGPIYPQVPEVQQPSPMNEEPPVSGSGHWSSSDINGSHQLPPSNPPASSQGSCGPPPSAHYQSIGSTYTAMQPSLYHQYLHQNPPPPYYLPPSPDLSRRPYYQAPLGQPPSFPSWPQWPPAFPPSRSNGPPISGQAPANLVNSEGLETKSLFIGNVGFKVTQKMIQDVFASKGFIVEVDLPMDSASGQHAGFGYVHFPGSHSAFAAMEALQGALIDGHAINLEGMHHPNTEKVRAVQNGSCGGSSVRASRPRHENRANRRRKSVSFLQNPADVGTVSGRPHSSGKDASGLLDSPSDDPGFSARFPSLQPVKNEQAYALSNAEGISVNPEKEMEIPRFPPVSQMDALLLTGQQESPKVPSTAGRSNGSEDPTRETRSASNKDAAGNILQVIDTGRPLGHNSSNGNSNTMVVMRPAADSNEPSDSSLKRRGTERQERRPSARSVERDTWARLSRRERTRSFSRQQVPGGFPVEETALPTADLSDEQSSEAVEQCVSALIDMGFGTEQEGGRSRMAVYAAAANGSLLDAIDMIEEERSAYERRSSH